MREGSAQRASTCVSRVIEAPRMAIYRACVDAQAVAAWRVPDNMTAEVHFFEPRAGGRYRISLRYRDRAGSPRGKTSGDTDTFEGRFLELVAGEKIVEVVEFESEDADFAGEMTIITRLSDVEGGTKVSILCQDLPPGIRPEDNEAGTAESLRKLAAMFD